MFQDFAFDTLTPATASFYLALILGAIFGLAAEYTKFCFRRTIVGTDRGPALGIWAMGLASAVVVTQVGVALDWLDFSEHRFLSTDLPLGAILVGGVLFGAGMVLSRGCASRLTVLTGTGNLRAGLTMVIFALAANATMKGPFAPIRQQLASVQFDITAVQSAVSGHGAIITLILSTALILVALATKNSLWKLTAAGILGLTVAGGWIGTSFVLYDDFDPIAQESIAFTIAAADGVFWITASSIVETKFTLGIIAGVLGGAFISAALGRRLQWVSFESPSQMGRYVIGAILMGFGGVTAGGCTVGAGLSGIATLSVAALLTLAAIGLGAYLMDRVLGFSPFSRGYDGSNTTLPQQPAE